MEREILRYNIFDLVFREMYLTGSSLTTQDAQIDKILEHCKKIEKYIMENDTE